MSRSQTIATHRGADIAVSNLGVFSTRADSPFGELSATNLDELKKKIDAAGGAVKGPATAFTLEGGDRTPKICPCKCGTLIRNSYGTIDVWVTSPAGNRSKEGANHVYQDTPENLALAEQWIQAKRAELAATKTATEIRNKMIAVNKSHGGKIEAEE